MSVMVMGEAMMTDCIEKESLEKRMKYNKEKGVFGNF